MQSYYYAISAGIFTIPRHRRAAKQAPSWCGNGRDAASCAKTAVMQPAWKPLAFISVICLLSFTRPAAPTPEAPVTGPAPRIQVAILLDVSGSMEGLIEQAKLQLWNMVSTLGKAQCTDNRTPQVELALYEYGRSSNEAAKGYVKQLTSFTSDLDSVSKILFSLRTNGGEEYCGQVIYTSMDELTWAPGPENYKVIFIAGNEDFLQGNLHYTKACARAKDKGVIVNTIYCGSYEQGIAEHWNLLGECGQGNYSNINQQAKEPDIPTPYDSTLIVLNNRLNQTYIGYGAMGFANTKRQEEVDQANFEVSTYAGVKRAEAKARGTVYTNAAWDMVDAQRADSGFIRKLDKSTLPDSLKNKTPEQLKQVVQQKDAERGIIQKQILELSAARNNYIAEEKKKAASQNNQPTLESAVEKTLREQVKRANMNIPNN